MTEPKTVDELCVLAAECLGMKQDRWGYWEYPNGKSIWIENTPFKGDINPIILSPAGRELMEEAAEKRGFKRTRWYGDMGLFEFHPVTYSLKQGPLSHAGLNKSKFIACTLAFVRMCGHDVELEEGE